MFPSFHFHSFVVSVANVMVVSELGKGFYGRCLPALQARLYTAFHENCGRQLITAGYLKSAVVG